MSSVKLIPNREAVLSAMEEFDQLTIKGVYKKYGFRDSVKFDVVDKTRPENRYPPKAIWGMAHGFMRDGKPLTWDKFSAGEDSNVPLSKLGFQIVEKHWTEGYCDQDLEGFPDRSADAIASQAIRIRRGQNKFREKLLTVYENRCAVSGCNVVELLEAAHVEPYAEEGEYSPANGIILRTDIHTLFDLGWLLIDPEELTIYIDKEISDAEYRKFHGLKIFQPQKATHRVSTMALRKRWTSI